jgi:hypothetical protein
VGSEAKEQAAQGWALQKGLRQVGEWEISAGNDPAPQHPHQWAAAIIYKSKTQTSTLAS